MIVIAGVISIDGAQTEAVTAAANTMRAATLEEDGCYEYRFSFATDDPHKVLIFEEWRDQEALNAHFAAPHMAAFQQAMAGFVTAAPSVSRYEVTSKGPLR